MRYVYLNPVRAGLVTRAADYAWSWIAAFDAPFAGPVPSVLYPRCHDGRAMCA